MIFTLVMTDGFCSDDGKSGNNGIEDVKRKQKQV